jgi:hypothetical protein
VRRSALIAMGSALLTLSACTAFSEEPSAGKDEASAPGAAVATAEPEELTLVTDGSAVALAAATSRALFESADVAVLAREGDDAGTLLAASAAAGLGVPLLLEAADGAEEETVAEELDRLGTGTVLAVGAARGEGSGPEVVTVPADPAAVAEATGLTWAGEEDAGDDPAAAVAALDPAEPAALLTGSGARQEADGGSGSLPQVERAEPLDGTVVLATGTPVEVAGLASARAAGARVVLTGGDTDPRAVPDVVAAMAEGEPSSVVVLGAGFAEEEGLDWKVATAATGVQLPAGGQTLFPESFMVALYGHPGTSALGVLGEQPVDAAIERARQHAAPYEDLVEGTVVPAFEIIATVASSSAGPDGNYSNEVPAEELRPWVDAAGEAGLYVVIDLQPGRTDFVTQAELYRSLLELPHVGLALDPEWRLGANEVHLTQIGSVDVEEVNRVVTWLADLTREKRLPQKLLVLHQFRLDMLPGRDRLDLARDELAVMVHADGQGGQGDKQATWRALRAGAQDGLWWGWKNFYDEDKPMLTPAQTVDQVDPLPQLISYQ